MADPVTIREKLGQDVYAGLCAASLTLAGNNARLHRAFSAGQVRIAFLGGSVIAGCLDNAYVPEPFPLHVVQRLRSAMPGKRFYLYDYSIAGTGSDYGLVCVRRELSLCRPQLVVVEYGINDAKTPESIGCFESLIRMLLQLPEKPAVCLLLVGMEDGYCCRAHMTRIAAHYGLPVVDAVAALEDAIRGGRLTWWDYAADSCHPHPAGHQWLGDCLFAGLNEWLSAPADAPQPLPPACAYHAPLTDLELLFLDALESPYEHRFGEDGLPMLLHTADHGGFLEASPVLPGGAAGVPAVCQPRLRHLLCFPGWGRSGAPPGIQPVWLGQSGDGAAVRRRYIRGTCTDPGTGGL